eukprot:5094883-Alexandrium_andersonii.AAC.1
MGNEFAALIDGDIGKRGGADAQDSCDHAGARNRDSCNEREPIPRGVFRNPAPEAKRAVVAEGRRGHQQQKR